MKITFNGKFYRNFLFWLGLIFLAVVVLENVYLDVAYNVAGVGAGILLMVMGLFRFTGITTRN
ncbi:hypothetical protein [Levilactobacillus suantsaii]|uniref:Uncharacterized protein n=1 Tax=Levilactobacillus suantsaii TaxID=2292255 RepID=A0A4Q0VG90_9LACO|nr:hypothetical protein [Levilactobacillus suantsaii]QMU08457.1 hypothetical protein H3M12_01920 [Levilactobacillus suantsaii]RXI77565.1 hypothetical protein DXH47_09035 [Levilactobacillus suantsaii]